MGVALYTFLYNCPKFIAMLALILAYLITTCKTYIRFSMANGMGTSFNHQP